MRYLELVFIALQSTQMVAKQALRLEVGRVTVALRALHITPQLAIAIPQISALLWLEPLPAKSLFHLQVTSLASPFHIMVAQLLLTVFAVPTWLQVKVIVQAPEPTLVLSLHSRRMLPPLIVQTALSPTFSLRSQTRTAFTHPLPAVPPLALLPILKPIRE
jgi:hypothetical protein